ncbi:SDR family oxidoreductase [Salipaludibacillus sp. HK11]|uniref:SDR family oxidoreductase n=1 Tax=Salipaludibacillus sp. HK11 TaxID=3394320 RepID=UPI0039FC4175
MTKYLVTGGSGFIGSNLVQSLLNKGESVKVLDNNSTGNKGNVQDYIDDIEWIEGDMTDYETIKKAVNGVDVVFHQGAIPSVPKSVKNPLATNHANVTGTLQLLYASVEENVSRVIYAASSSAYGDTETLSKKEDMPGKPLSPYAVSKYIGEHYCKVFYEIYGLETISLRYFNVFGPKQDPHSEYAAVIPKFIHSILHDEPPTIYGDGKQSRDFTYVENAILANLLAASAPKVSGEVINVGTGNSINLNSLVNNINTLVGKNIPPIHLDERIGDVKHSLANIEKAYNLIGYKPKVSFDDGLKQTVNWFQKIYTS